MVEKHVPEQKKDVIPSAVALSTLPSSTVYAGREAIVTKAFSEQEKLYALKWYAILDGEPTSEFKEYAHQVKRDENDLYDTGLTKEQVPPSHFFIAESANGSAGLYAIQPWVNGEILKNTSIRTIIQNRTLRTNLADLYLKAAKVYEHVGRLPDLSGGDKTTILGKTIPDPRKTFWPLRTTNIMTSDNSVILHDARAHNKAGLIKQNGIKLHRLLTIALAKSILTLNKIEDLRREK